jgi:hypothetical protein
MSLVTTANYKYYLGISQSDTTKDTELALLYSAVENRVKVFLGRDLEWSAYTEEYYDGSGYNSLVLRQYPIIAVSSIQEYGGIQSGNTEDWDTLVEHTDYDRLLIPFEAHKVILDGYRFGKGIQNFKVSYYAGYSTGATLVSGSLVVGKKYKILARSAVDFTTKGSSSNAVGTEFVATATATMSATDSVLELVALPSEIEWACKELVKITLANSPISGDNRLGFTSVSSNAGGGSQNLNIDPEIEQKILNKIIQYKAINV